MSDNNSEGKTWKENFWWTSWSVLILFQIIFGFLRYNPDGSNILRIVGGGIMIIGFVLGAMGVFTLKRMGGIPKKEKSRSFGVGTTVLVTNGIYATVRHPQYLSWIFFHIAVILIAQNWIVASIGVVAMLTIYMQTRQDDQELVEKFGDAYKSYMRKVPRINLLLGIIRLL